MKKSLTTILLFFYLLFSSGIVVYAFECVELKHVHVNLLHKIDCSDFSDETEAHHWHNHNKSDKLSDTLELISCDCYHEHNNSELESSLINTDYINFLNNTFLNNLNIFNITTNNSDIKIFSASCGVSKTTVLNIGIDILHIVENLRTIVLSPTLALPAFFSASAQDLLSSSRYFNKFSFQIDNSLTESSSSYHNVCYIRTITSSRSSEFDKSNSLNNNIFRAIV